MSREKILGTSAEVILVELSGVLHRLGVQVLLRSHDKLSLLL